MGIIMWDKPKKMMTEKTRQKRFQSDCDIPGTYFPNMSLEDRKRWKGKVVGKTTGSPQVEIRKNTFVIIVSLGGGYKYKYYSRDKTKRTNIHIGASGPIQLTFKEWEEMKYVVDEATQVLRELSD